MIYVAQYLAVGFAMVGVILAVLPRHILDIFDAEFRREVNLPLWAALSVAAVVWPIVAVMWLANRMGRD